MKPFPWLSVLALVVSVSSVFFLRSELSRYEAILEALEDRISPRPNDVHAAVAHAPDALGEASALRAVEERLESLERAPVEGPRGSQAEAQASEASSTEKPLQPSPGIDAELDELIGRINAANFDWSNSEELQRFYELVGDGKVLEERVAQLEGLVEANPDDLALRMELADTCIAKLMTLQGPEQSLWGAKAEKQWVEVASRDEDHWQSRFRIGNNLAYYPDVMGKTDEAIGYLQEARDIQLRSAAAPEHVPTVLSLARLYQRKGDVEQARELLLVALQDHGVNAELERALASLGD